MSDRLAHFTCLQLLALCWGGVHQFFGLSLLAAVMSSERPPSMDSHATSTLASNASDGSFAQEPLEETYARRSKEAPCRAFHPLTFPRDGHNPSDEAAGSDEFPPKRTEAVWDGIDEMGPWRRPRAEEALLLAQQTVHMNPGCLLITRGTFQLSTCYCVDKLHRCFHYDVDSDFVLHTNRRCSENADVEPGLASGNHVPEVLPLP